MDASGLLERFQLENETVLHDEVEMVGARNNEVFVHEVHGNVAIETDSRSRQFMGKARSVGCFETPRPKSTMHPDATANHRTRDLVLSLFAGHARSRSSG